MQNMNYSSQKIFLDISDNINLVLKKLEKIKSKEVILNIPMNSVLGKSFNSLQTLKKQATRMKKKILIESVDDHILDLAALEGFSAINPVFKTKGKTVYDILPAKLEKNNSFVPINKQIEEESDEDENEDNEDSNETNNETDNDYEQEVKISKKRFWLRNLFIILIILGICGSAGYWAIAEVLPRATIELTLKDYPVDLVMPVKIDINEPTLKEEKGILIVPGELVKSRKNLTMNFPTQNKEKVEKYAEGKLIIYNVYSSEPQTLVEKTRFETPDGKIFRLKQRIIIPGAKVQTGKITSSQIEAAVVADKPGDEYNIGPIAQWTIPGFKDTPKYNGFYAKSASNMQGGILGSMAVPKESEIADAKKKIQENLQMALEREITVLTENKNYENFKDTKIFEIKNEKISSISNDDSQFNVFMEGEMSEIIFQKGVIESALTKKGIANLPQDINFKLKTSAFDYKDKAADLKKGEILFNAALKGIFEADVNLKDLTDKLLRKKSQDVKNIIFQVPGLEQAHISMWPFWVKNIPGNPKKVKIITL